jgi:two-component system CheB/CheR fusion protein
MSPEAPSRPKRTVVGIGASAGGFAALKTFFAHVPPDSGLSFVVVVHLSPDHESHLAELLQPHVSIPIEQVNEATVLEPNHVYVIPPNANINTIDTHLRLTKLEERRHRAPIDNFFRTLAETHDGHAVAVILTGSGSDGSVGITDIKANAGLVIVQDPREAEYDGMPHSAVATGLADFVLPVAEIPQTILRFDRTDPHLPQPKDGEEVSSGEQALMQKLFAQLRARTDRDFSRYKRSTIMRRVARRMQLNYLESLPSYIDRLRTRPEEARALADDLLITVTHFFRDPAVFERLENEVVPRLFEKKSAPETVRAWSVGCATGEEAYSLAMLLLEQAERQESPPQIQVFASDLHTRALEKAREGLYAADITKDVSPERLKRFFQQENGGYRIRKEVRDLVVFASHNLLSDPPFSRLDLICCRNLLIYLERDVHRDVIELFHYALNPDGALVLGSAESLEATDLFLVEDKKLCIFRKRNVPAPEPRLPVFPLTKGRMPGEDGVRTTLPAEPLAYRRLHQHMVEQNSLPSLLIGPDNKIVHLSDRAGRYLIHPGGEPTASVLKLARPELRFELQALLNAAREKRQPVDSHAIEVQFNGQARPVVLHVRPALETVRYGFALILFEEQEPTAPDQPTPEATTPSDWMKERIAHLETELTVSRQRHQALVEEYETNQEEMKASSEEMQSTNEELHSTMEELETSKEELQSINEELQTVNQQNRQRLEEMSQLSSDLQNLLAATDIATLFLDRELRILRYMPKLGELFNMRVSDVGRSIFDLKHRLVYGELRGDAEAVIGSLMPVEREVQDDHGRWYVARVRAYRSVEDRIEGVVITFVDIDTRKRAEEGLRASEERLRRILNIEVVGVLTLDQSGTLIDGNEAFLKMSGYSLAEIASRKLTWSTMTPPEYVEITERQMQNLARTGRIGPYEKEYLRKDGSRSWMLLAGANLPDGTTVEFCIDVGDRKRAEEQVGETRLYAESIINSLHDPLLVLTPELRVQTANSAFYRNFEVSPEDTLGKNIYDLGNGQWNIPALRTLLDDILPRNHAMEDFLVEHVFQNIGRRVMLLNARRLDGVHLILLERRDAKEQSLKSVVSGGLSFSQ